NGGVVEIWDASSGKNVFSKQIGSAVRCVTFSPDGRHLAIGQQDGAVRLYQDWRNREDQASSMSCADCSLSMTARSVPTVGGWLDAVRLVSSSSGTLPAPMTRSNSVTTPGSGACPFRAIPNTSRLRARTERCGSGI